MSGNQAGEPAGVTDQDLAEHRRAVLRMKADAALAELQGIASGHTSDANGAALSLVGAAIEACERLRAAVAKNPGAFAPIAQRMIKWPLTHSLFPGERVGLTDYVVALQLGSRAPLNLGKWRMTAPGTRWAVGY